MAIRHACVDLVFGENTEPVVVRVHRNLHFQTVPIGKSCMANAKHSTEHTTKMQYRLFF